MKEMNTIEEYIKEVPEDVKEAIKALSDDTRLAIVVALLKHGEFTFSQLMETLRVNSSVLSHHLKSLINASLIKNYYAKKPESEEYSFYDLTSYGEQFMRSVYGLLDVPNALEEAITRACSSNKPYEIRLTGYSPEIEGVLVEIEKTKARMVFKPSLLRNLNLFARKEEQTWK